MSKQKKDLVPELRFPEFEKEPNWPCVRLNAVAKRSTSKNKGEKITRVLTNSAVDGVVDQRDYFDKDIAVKGNLESYYIVDKGDYVYNPRISSTAPVGPISKNKVGKGVMSPLYTVFRFNSKKNDFFEQFFKSSKWCGYLQTVSNSGVRHDRMSITSSEFMAMPVPNPCELEQQKIADCLASIDELSTLHTQKLDALKDYKKGLMQQLFPAEGETVPKLRFPEFQGKGEWVKKPLERVIEIASGQVDPTKSPYCDMPHIGGENIESDSGKILNVSTAKDLNLISGKYAFDESYILYSKIRPALNKVARPNFKGICSADIYPIRPATDELLQSFLSYILLSKEFLDHAKKHSDRGKIPKVNREAVMAYIASLPAPDEQYRIADFLCSIDELLASQTLRVKVLRAHKNGLMQKLFPVMDEVV
ncbi:restriction endonuclease subunit S [Dickeya dadantii]|uniref:restriction endonuclease subunit S n=1 Tax=Dickeya dadantii TaxID=204038 RepID=UPI00149544F0|nr:restriction endonuclease subunit S [Dickeya dadantii]NPE60751.1 restriction endonuclease subunit S [Dickeya dadantii]NPE70506.1 restriction endonuclease subunit S [Dickeya dadantii]